MTAHPAPPQPADIAATLLASIPSMLGFHPEDSLVFIGMDACCDTEVRLLLRSDLVDPADRDRLACQLSDLAATHGITRAYLFAIGGPPNPPDPLPARALVAAVTKALDRQGISTGHALWARRIQEGESWQCYADRAHRPPLPGPHPDHPSPGDPWPEPPCDSCSGTLPDPASTPAAAALAFAGGVIHTSRSALSATLAPDPPAALDRRADLLRGRQMSTPEAVRTVTTAIERCVETGAADLDDASIAGLATALADPHSRGVCLAATVSRYSLDAERLWHRLTRALPAPERADPAWLLATSAYLRGDGAFASVALETALAADPDQPTARLLRGAFDAAIPPPTLKHLLAKAIDMPGAPPDRPPREEATPVDAPDVHGPAGR